MSKIKALRWTQTARGPDRWEGRSSLERVYIITRGDKVWLFGIEGAGWKEAKEDLDDAKARCQADWTASLLAEIES